MDELILDRAYDVAPNVATMVTEMQQSITDASSVRTRHSRAWDARRAYWPGQSPDGRKWEHLVGDRVFPFNGSSDKRIFTCEEVVGDEVMILMAAFWQATFQVTGLESQDTSWGTRMTQLLKWMYYTKMLRGLSMQTERVAQWRQTFGISVSGVEWEQRIRAEYQTLDTQQIAQMLQQSDPAAGYMEIDAASLLFGDRENEALEFLRSLSPLIKGNLARKMLTELRQNGQTRMPVPYLLRNQPRRRALRAMCDVFWNADSDDLQEARWIAEVELIDEAELRGRVITDDYDTAFVEDAIKRAKGVRVFAGAWANRGVGLQGVERQLIEFGRSAERRIELVHFYHKATGDDYVPALHKTTFCPALNQNTLTPNVAKSGMLEYAHGEYPYIAHVREYATPCLLDSRGSAELAEDTQQVIKSETDSRTDLSSLATMPPIFVAPGKLPPRFELRPNSLIPLRRPDEMQFMKIPQMQNGSIEVEKSSERRLDRLLGRMTENVQPDKQAGHAQKLAKGWLIEHRLCATQEIALMQQYLDEVEVTHVVGVTDRPFHVSNDEIRGAFDLQIAFDARELNPEFAMQKMKAIGEYIVPLDKFGVLDLAGIVAYGMRGIDPQLADKVVQNQDAASSQEVDATQSDLMKILNGFAPALKEKGVNWQLRMQVVQAAMQDPSYQSKIAADPGAQEKFKGYVDWLQQGMAQGQNAIIGRFGTLPGRVAA